MSWLTVWNPSTHKTRLKTPTNLANILLSWIWHIFEHTHKQRTSSLQLPCTWSLSDIYALICKNWCDDWHAGLPTKSLPDVLKMRLGNAMTSCHYITYASSCKWSCDSQDLVEKDNSEGLHCRIHFGSKEDFSLSLSAIQRRAIQYHSVIYKC